MDRSARTICAALEDPLQPRFCTACLSIFVEYTEVKADAAFGWRTLRQEHHKLWSSSVAFILAASAPEVQPALAHTLRYLARVCPSQISNDKLERHRSLVAYYTSDGNTLHAAIDVLCRFLRGGLDESVLRLSTKQRFTRNGLWPQAATDLLPTGPEQWLFGMSHWLRIIHSWPVIQAFEAIYSICRPELQPLLATALHRTTTIDAICTQLEFATAAARSNDTTGDRAERADLRIRSAASLLANVAFGSGPAFALSFGGMARRIVNAAQGAIDLVREPATKDKLALVASIMAICTPSLRNDGYSLLRPSTLQRMMALIQKDIPPDVWQFSFHVLKRSSLRDTCCWTECDRQGGGDATLRVCSRCHVVRYCGPSCQKAHWRSSHRDVCQTLKGLFAQLGLTFTSGLTEEQFTSACRAASVDIRRVTDAIGVLATETSRVDGIAGPTSDRTFAYDRAVFAHIATVISEMLCLHTQLSSSTSGILSHVMDHFQTLLSGKSWKGGY